MIIGFKYQKTFHICSNTVGYYFAIEHENSGKGEISLVIHSFIEKFYKFNLSNVCKKSGINSKIIPSDLINKEIIHKVVFFLSIYSRISNHITEQIAENIEKLDRASIKFHSRIPQGTLFTAHLRNHTPSYLKEVVESRGCASP